MDDRARLAEAGHDVEGYALIGTDEEPVRWACSPEHLGTMFAAEREITEPLATAVIRGHFVPLNLEEWERWRDSVLTAGDRTEQ